MKRLPAIQKPKAAGEKIAVFGDIHSNLEALKAVVADMKQQGVTRFFCTGDIVGYGADPCACIRHLIELGAAAVRGNHDDYCTALSTPSGVNSDARATIAWTRQQLDPRARQWLQNLPMALQSDGIAVTHSSFEAGRCWPYILQPPDAAPSLLEQPEPLAFYGHTHRPTVFTKGPGRNVQQKAFSTHCLKNRVKAFINPGSVGQPRDGDPRAAYALFDPTGRTVTLRRVVYDIDTAAAKIAEAGLPFRNADRLCLGK